jgi:hypothetical protein
MTKKNHQNRFVFGNFLVFIDSSEDYPLGEGWQCQRRAEVGNDV